MMAGYTKKTTRASAAAPPPGSAQRCFSKTAVRAVFAYLSPWPSTCILRVPPQRWVLP